MRFRYTVAFTRDLFASANPLLRQTLAPLPGDEDARCLFVLDDMLVDANPRLPQAIAQYCHDHRIAMPMPPRVVPGGEPAKNDPSHLERLYQAIVDARLCRHSCIIAVGGGAMIDWVGYAAATAHRGIRLVRVPTTVLGQNDSGVGVKNSMNAVGRKNFLGTFAPPFAVLNDAALLTTLPQRDWIAGISEAVKVALIKDRAFFNQIERDTPALLARDLATMEQLVYRCAKLHLDHIRLSGDPFESGSSRPLDFGHWSAHKLEQLSQYQLRHGEAVAAGIALDCTYAWRIGLLEQPVLERILTCLRSLQLPTFVPQMSHRLDDPDHPQSLFHGLAEFREHLGGRLTILLLKDIASPIEVQQMDLSHLRESIDWLASHTATPAVL